LVNKNQGEKIYATTANNAFLVNQEYATKYINADSSTIIKESKERLTNNTKLLEGIEVSLSNKTYSESFLGDNLNLIKEDLKNCTPNSPEYFSVYSRLLKNEYMLYVKTKNLAYLDGYRLIQDKDISINEIYFDEIDFLTLTNYLILAAEKEKNIFLLEMALNIVYQPYSSLRSDTHKWTYNTMVNSIINKIITMSYQQNRFEDTIYYMSLNKSRMIIEERFMANKTYDSNNRNIMLKLPEKKYFKEVLSKTENYLDFYIAGDYTSQQTNLQNESKNSNNMRSLKLAIVDNSLFNTNGMYVSYVDNSKVSIKRYDKNDLKMIEENVNVLYADVSSFNSEIRSAKKRGLKVQTTSTLKNKDILSPLSRFLPTDIKKSSSLVISSDKWLSKIPFDILIELDQIRTLNIFTLNDQIYKEKINPNIVGYFNPTGDLTDAEEEIPLIAKSQKNFRYFKRGDASKEKLKHNEGQNIIHLSMHGFNNSNDPEYSKLLFANSEKSETKNDTNALYAKEMQDLSQLKNNKLVFTAACETGLVKASANNSEELLGILRPLLKNKNENIILTLWEIDSESAKKFVEYFYTYLAETKNIQSAFFKAKQQLRYEYKDPYYWAPYYLISQKGNQ